MQQVQFREGKDKLGVRGSIKLNMDQKPNTLFWTLFVTSIRGLTGRPTDTFVNVGFINNFNGKLNLHRGQAGTTTNSWKTPPLSAFFFIKFHWNGGNGKKDT